MAFKVDYDARIGLALGGGAVWGAAHLGVLRALHEEDIQIHCITGTSIGAVVASLYAFEVQIDEITEFARNLDWLHVSGITIPRKGLFSNEGLAKQMRKILGDAEIERAKIPLAIVAGNIATGEKVIFRQGSVADAVQASSCIPGLYAPVEIDGQLLVDGFIVENVPVSPLKEMGARRIIAVSLSGNPNYEKPDGIIDILFNAFEIAIDTHTSAMLRSADVVIAPKLGSFSRADARKVPELIEIGYNSARDKMRDIWKLYRKRRMFSSFVSSAKGKKG